MALGATAINVGLFLGSAKAIRWQTRHLISYALGGFLPFFLIMRALGEMAIPTR